MVLITLRIVASALKAVGDAVNAAKAWFVVNKLSQIFDRKGLIVLSEYIIIYSLNRKYSEDMLIRFNSILIFIPFYFRCFRDFKNCAGCRNERHTRS